jgi:hypothetical protein
LVLEGIEGGKSTRLVITVLIETKLVDGVETMVVEERVTEVDILAEVALNYFAICQNTNSVFYFAEDVDNSVNGQFANHDGSWLAGRRDSSSLLAFIVGLTPPFTRTTKGGGWHAESRTRQCPHG